MFRVNTCLHTYLMVMDSSSCCVVCLHYECLLSWIGYIFYSVFVSLSSVQFLHCFEYLVIDFNICVIHVQSGFTNFIYPYGIFSNVFRCFPFLSIFTIFTVSGILQYARSMFSMWFEYPHLSLLFLIAFMWSLYLVKYVRPVFPTYFIGQSILWRIDASYTTVFLMHVHS
jgi:hypothetical protein